MDQSLSGRRVALIGGAGFIGHTLAMTLHKLGAHVEVIDGLQVNNLGALAAGKHSAGNSRFYMNIIMERLDEMRRVGITLHNQDARDYNALCRVLNQVRPQVVVQLAAVAHAARSNKDPFSTFDHSLRTLENALDWSRGEAEHFIYLSSSMVYGQFHDREVTEDLPLDPIGIYGALKMSGEKLTIAYNQVFDMPYTIIRPSAVYGPRDVGRRVVQIFLENAQAGYPLRINGDGAEKLDFTFVQDLVDGICAVIGSPQAKQEVFNLTNGSSRTILELAQLVKSHFPQVELEFAKRDKLMPVRGTLSINKARELLGFDPQNSLEKGLDQYVGWYKRFAKDWSFKLDCPLECQTNGLS